MIRKHWSGSRWWLSLRGTKSARGVRHAGTEGREGAGLWRRQGFGLVADDRLVFGIDLARHYLAHGKVVLIALGRSRRRRPRDGVMMELDFTPMLTWSPRRARIQAAVQEPDSILV